MSLERQTTSQINWKRNAALSTQVYFMVWYISGVGSPLVSCKWREEEKKSNVNKDHTFVLSQFLHHTHSPWPVIYVATKEVLLNCYVGIFFFYTCEFHLCVALLLRKKSDDLAFRVWQSSHRTRVNGTSK